MPPIPRNLMRLPRNGLAGGTRLPSPPLFLPRLAPVAIFSAFVLFLLLLQIASDVVSRTRTVVGHNLQPTPWHLFEPRQFTRGPLTRARIFQCSYLSCSAASSWQAPSSPPAKTTPQPSPPVAECPFYFRWIHEDLAPWAGSRISAASLMEARQNAALRIVIVGGRLYADFYYACVQSRAMFTLWGLLQLLRRYPGRVPDVDLMFDCMDKPVLNRSAAARLPPPPLFRYCTTSRHFDIPFPDWSFWGWPEVNIGPWEEEFGSIKNGSKSRDWNAKHPIAYWKGNPDVQSPVRENLLNCNDTEAWGAQVLRQNWLEEAKSGFEQSKLANQCAHMYKIYAEGYAWSVSLKYILSCGSLTLIIDPQYSDFFSRGLKPREDYWPISPNDLCPSIRSAVNWGNKHPSEAKSVGKGGQDYVGEAVAMDRVYDYMYHLLVEYSKLQDFKPTAPSSAQEICEESLLCFSDEKQREVLKKSSASLLTSPPCTLPAADHQLMERWAEDRLKKIRETENFLA